MQRKKVSLLQRPELLQSPADEEPEIFLCKLARKVDFDEGATLVLQGSEQLDKACKKLKQEHLTAETIDRLKHMNVQPKPAGPFDDLAQRKLAQPGKFESQEPNVFLLTRPDKEELKKHFRTQDVSQTLGERRKQFVARSRLAYFDEETLEKKPLRPEDLAQPEFDSQFARIEVIKASEVNTLRNAKTVDLSSMTASGGLARYIVSPLQIAADSRSSSSHHSSDSNASSHKKNDYGDTPSSRSKRSDQLSDSEEDEVADVEFDGENADKVKKIFKMMERNRDDSSEDYEEQDEIYRYNSKMKKVYNVVAYDAWYNRDDED